LSLLTHTLEVLRAALAGRYTVERELGRGGMARVYLAHDLKHDRPVALKVMQPELAATLGQARFLQEIRLCARLQHPHILAVLDSGAEQPAGGELLWFTMPFVEGESLRGRLAREGRLPVADALRLAREVGEGLDYAHRHGVVHRDIKPENILLSGGHGLIADFGIARALAAGGQRDDRLTETGIALGTPYYMSPEQATGDRNLDARTDVYSLGCVLYEMLAGEPPFTGPNQQAILAQVLTGQAPRLGTVREIPAAVDHAVARALARSPGDRFASAADFAGALETAQQEPASRRGAPGRGRRLVAVALAVVLPAGLLAGYFLLGRADRGGSVPPAASAAVLPFVDLSPGRDQEYFSDGLTEELITSLSQVEGLRVAARTSSFQFKGRSADVREVGRNLDVGAVLEGSVRRSGNRLRIAAQLVNVADGYQLWSQAYDREVTDVFAVQEEIARAIVEALRVKLGVAAGAALSAVPTRDLEAYDLYLKGRFAWNQRSAAAMPEAVRYLEGAVARDSGFARAWAALADSYILLVPYAGASRDSTWPKARAAAETALALDSTLAEAHTALAYGTMIYGWDWPAAEASFRRAIAANPNYPTGHHWYGDFLAGRGRLEESLREMQRAQALDPLSRIIGVELGWIYRLMGRDDEAEAQLRRTLALDPNYAHARFNLGLVFLEDGRHAEAIQELRRSIELGGDYDIQHAALICAYARSGDQATARRLLDELTVRAKRGEFGSFTLAIAYTGLGELDRAFELLHQAIDERDLFQAEIFFDPLLHPLRGDPRYARVLERMGIDPASITPTAERSPPAPPPADRTPAPGKTQAAPG
jgi:TolB-like protein/Tfp pilus assembly protein PilF/tRNA A-37 threonylcarbamoyl transferase component Bud32